MDGTGEHYAKWNKLPRTLNPNLITRRISEKSQLGDMLQDTSPVYLKMVKVIKVKESLKNHNSQQEPKEMSTKCDIEPWMGSWNSPPPQKIR